MAKYTIALAAALIGTMLVSACSSVKTEQEFPKTNADERREARGRLGGEEGLNLFGGRGDDRHGSAQLGVNGYLWRATLDTLSFVPLSSVDPRGGVIISDWSESPDAPGERFKINASILDTRLRADGIKVSVFRQELKGGQWRDASVNTDLARALEDKILTRARELRIKEARG